MLEHSGAVGDILSPATMRQMLHHPPTPCSDIWFHLSSVNHVDNKYVHFTRTNIATDKTSQAVAHFHFFHYFDLFGFITKLLLPLDKQVIQPNQLKPVNQANLVKQVKLPESHQ